MRIVDLNSLATQAHENAVKHGWWEKERNNQHHLMLVIAEIAEAVEADRDKKHARLSEYIETQRRRNAHSAVSSRIRSKTNLRTLPSIFSTSPGNWVSTSR